MKQLLAFLILLLNYNSIFAYPVQSVNESSSNKSHIKGSVGLLVLNETKNYKSVTFYNRDGTVWQVLSLNENATKKVSKEIMPYAFHIDYHLLVLRCIKIERDFYQVIVNEKSRLVKYVKKDDSVLLFQSWEQHVSSAFSVDFDPSKNPLKAKPDNKSETLDFSKNEFYLPIKTQGEWLMVKWGNKRKWHFGWIRWRSGGNLLINLYYFA